jgi:carbonic anhydrase
MGNHGQIGTPFSIEQRASRYTRRRFLGTTVAAGVGGLLALSMPSLIGKSGLAFAAEESMGPTADEALKILMDGNARYVANTPAYPDQSEDRRLTVAKAQSPIAIVIGCSDSRVTPELAFDQGLGDLFVIRVAGNVVDDQPLGSIEYGLEELHIPLVMVLGHERCGAVKATLDLSMAGGEAPGHIQSLVKAIQPAVDQAKTQTGDTLDLAIIANVGNVVAQLKTSQPIISGLIHDEKVKIVGAHYDLETGEVVIVA